MKKLLYVTGIVLVCASMVFAAAVAKMDLKALKGTWEGFASAGPGKDANLKIEIMNDAEPVQGKATLSNITAGDWSRGYGITDPWILESNEGKITSKGTVMFLGGSPGSFFEIISIGKDKSGKPTATGWFYTKGVKADFSVTKK